MLSENQDGFTLIELLIVVVIIGILASIAIPKYTKMRERAYYSALKSDLRNLATQQEIYYSENYDYTDVTADLGFVQSEGVTVALGSVSSTGWNATATHRGLGTDEGCAVFHGTAAAPTVGSETPTAPGAVVCTD